MRSWFLLGSIFLFLAVAFGAFGAHGLEKSLSLKAIQTFKTGVTYQFYHGFGLLFIGLLGHMNEGLLKKAGAFFVVGILLFSFNCYLYAMTQVKAFAMIVPIGGVSFLCGWGTLIFAFLKRDPTK